jgi:hypothetical protein
MTRHRSQAMRNKGPVTLSITRKPRTTEPFLRRIVEHLQGERSDREVDFTTSPHPSSVERTTALHLPDSEGNCQSYEELPRVQSAAELPLPTYQSAVFEGSTDAIHVFATHAKPLQVTFHVPRLCPSRKAQLPCARENFLCRGRKGLRHSYLVGGLRISNLVHLTSHARHRNG